MRHQIFSMCRTNIEEGGVDIQENKLKRFVLARFLHHNILELKDLLILCSQFIEEETEVWGDYGLPAVTWPFGSRNGSLTPGAGCSHRARTCGEVLGEEVALW